jgi:hypothetical protein
MSQAQSKFAVDFTWEGTAKCFDPKSPPFSLSGVPVGTKVLRFAMKDLDAPSFPHGGGSVPYHGQTQLERGAFPYKGPCRPRDNTATNGPSNRRTARARRSPQPL